MTHTGQAHFPTTKQSKVVWANDVAITKAKITLAGSGVQLNFSLGTSNTWDGTYDWEQVATGEVTNYEYTMINNGKFLKWRALGVNYNLTNINIKVNEGI